MARQLRNGRNKQQATPCVGWKELLDGWPWFRGRGAYPIAAYSEFMPPLHLGRKPYGCTDPLLFADDDPWGWPVTEYEETFTLYPGLVQIARQVLPRLAHRGRQTADDPIPYSKMGSNPYWPRELAERAGRLRHERYVVLLPLALSRTQDDKGRMGWTLFGGSEQGPARPFWQSFFTAPGREIPEDQALAFLRRLLRAAYAEPDDRLLNLRAAGLRILPQGDDLPLAYGPEPLPGWTAALLWSDDEPVERVRYLLTFRPFARLPRAVRRAYLQGRLHLIPYPGSLLFWGLKPYLRLQRELPLAMQVPLLHLVERHEGPHGIRVPQAGWLHEKRPGAPEPDAVHAPLRGTYKRTHGQAISRDEDPLVSAQEDDLTHVLFSTDADVMGLYEKPMARNAQLWTHDCRLLLDGPRADRPQIRQAEERLQAGGVFGYRFQFPAMRLGLYEVYWQRPLVAYLSPESDAPVVLRDAVLGYFTAYRTEEPDPAHPVELWPRRLQRDAHRANVEVFRHADEDHQHQTLQNVARLLNTRQLVGGPLPHAFARQLLTLPREQTLESWLHGLPQHAADVPRARELANEIRRGLEPEPRHRPRSRPPRSLTFGHTARRSFEVAYWNTIARLAHGEYVNKNNADCVLDRATQEHLKHPGRDLEPLGDFLLTYYLRLIAERGMTGQAQVGDFPFRWETHFDYRWMGGWLNNQTGSSHERDLIVIIPGRDRSRAVLMADHYDTAYMSDHYEKDAGGDGARLAAPGADDNGSATAALLLAAPIFLDLSRRGRLERDIWLVHLTGEEFPAESLGARYLSQALVEGDLVLCLPDGGRLDLSDVMVQGVYVLDMIGHNTRKGPYTFQIAPGSSRDSLWLAYQAHRANEVWNASVPFWNRGSSRRGQQVGRRPRRIEEVPACVPHPTMNGEVRLHYDARSTLYNSDGRIFSDAGIPSVLFMENYDLNRSGYHDSQDTLANLHLDYGAALAAIAIEAVARAATEEPLVFGG